MCRVENDIYLALTVFCGQPYFSCKCDVCGFDEISQSERKILKRCSECTDNVISVRMCMQIGVDWRLVGRGCCPALALTESEN